MSGADAFPFQLTEAQWRAKLTPEQYRILRMADTEMPHSCALNTEKRAGVFYCAGCGQALFASRGKFDSGTGWPSFTAPISPDAVGTSTDYKIGYARTEVHCAQCGGHLGHVFNDGPPPTHLRYCLNGAVLDFVADD